MAIGHILGSRLLRTTVKRIENENMMAFFLRINGFKLTTSRDDFEGTLKSTKAVWRSGMCSHIFGGGFPPPNARQATITESTLVGGHKGALRKKVNDFHGKLELSLQQPNRLINGLPSGTTAKGNS